VEGTKINPTTNESPVWAGESREQWGKTRYRPRVL